MKNEPCWKLELFDSSDKCITLRGPATRYSPFVADIDYDDVDRDSVEIIAKRMVDLLNKYWID